jgi:hypothetical protein
MIFDLMVLKDRGHAALQRRWRPPGESGGRCKPTGATGSPTPCPTGSTPDLLSSDGNGLAPFLDARGIDRRIERMTHLLRLDPTAPRRRYVSLARTLPLRLA